MVPEPVPGELPRLRWDDVCARRLARHRLIAAATEPVADTVAAICGAHAQVMSAAELAVGLRCADVGRAGVRQALWHDLTLVKTFGPRGTVHLLPARDLPMWCGVLGGLPVRTGSDSALLNAAQQEAVVAAIAAALASDVLTVKELDGAVRSACGPWAEDLVVPAFGGYWPRWRQAVNVAASAGVLCFGPARGRQVTYTSPAHWLPGFQPAPAQPALSQLLHAYLHAYGPATSAQFAQWLAAPRRWAEQVITANAAQVDAVELDGARAWVNAGDTAPGTDPPPGIRLLPYFDPYLVGSHPRPLLFSGRARDRALSRGQAGTFPVLLVDGTVAGVWHQRRSGKRLHVTVEPFGRLGPAHRSQLESEVDRVGKILDARPELTMGPVTTGAHA
jgi:Winged helix DNA-binding domain